MIWLHRETVQNVQNVRYKYVMLITTSLRKILSVLSERSEAVFQTLSIACNCKTFIAFQRIYK